VDPDFVSMFVDEARLAARVRSPHVVPTVDVVATAGELFLVMDYVPGESLAHLVRAAAAKEPGGRVPVPVAVAVLSGVLRGLHAAHEAQSERGEPLGIVHRDVSPQNVLVGTDGLARVLDFGVAKAAGRLQTTRDGQLKGKLSYMAPEQLRSEVVTRRADTYAAAVVLWEVLTGDRLFASESEGGVVTQVLLGKVEAPSRVVGKRTPAADDETLHALEQLDAVVLRGLARDPTTRFETARDMAAALEEAVPPASAAQVSEWVERVAGPVLAERAARIAAIERGDPGVVPVDVAAPGAETAAEAQSAGGDGLPTQVSSISVATNATRSDAARGSRRSMIALAAGAALAVLGVTLMVRSSRGPSADSPAAPPSSVSTAATSTSDPSAAASPAGSSPEAPQTSAAASTPASPPPPSSGPAARPPPATTPTHTAPARRPAPRVNCNPPFTWDSLGKKHYKAECL